MEQHEFVITLLRGWTSSKGLKKHEEKFREVGGPVLTVCDCNTGD